MAKTKMTRIEAIRTFFASDGGRKLTMAELKELSREERTEMALSAAKELSVELIEKG